MKKFLKWLDESFEETLLVLLLVVIIVAMMVHVILRYVFSSGLIWADELCRQCFIATAFIGSGYCIKKKILMRLDSIQKALPYTIRCCMEILVDVIMAAAFLYLTIGGYTVIVKAIKAGTRTVIMQIPMSAVYTVVFIGYILGIVRSVQKVIEDIALMVKDKKKGE